MVKLFNVIQQSQSAVAIASEESKNSRGSGKPSLPAPSFEKGNSKKKGRQKDNLLGRGKDGWHIVPFLALFVSPDIKAAVALDKEDFMDVIRSGVNVRV